jgi:hypothetical protein
MTYNFDPDRWLDNQRHALDGRLARGEIDAERYQAEIEALERRYQSLTSTLDKPFELPRGTARLRNGS